MTTYELTTGTREDFENVKAQLISDFIQQVTGAEVNNQLLGHGYITSCLNPCNSFESLIFTVHYDLDETKHYGAAVALSSGSLKFVDASLDNIWDDFVVEQYKLKAAYGKAVDEAQRRQKEEKKKAEQLKKAEAKNKTLKEKAIKDFEALTRQAKKAVAQQDEFYYALGWLAKHVGSVSATLPDYLEGAFVKYFGDEAPHRVVDSNKRTVNGNSMQWTFGFTATLRKFESIPAMLNQYLSCTGKAIANTSFIWDLVSDYGFKFGKKQDTLDIMRCVPIEYVPMFNEGLKA